MEATGTVIGLGNHLKEELPVSERCLEELREIRNHIAEVHTGSIEIFDFGLHTGLSATASVEEKIERLMRVCIWHAIGLKTEFKLKLLYTIDGYLSSVDSKNPVSTFLLARYLLELAATVNFIDNQLAACLEIDMHGEAGMHGWNRRALSFLAVLFRARHSTSSEKVKPIFANAGIPLEAVHPIKIGKAIKQLTSQEGFKSAQSLYNSLSNICHHNGSGHKLLVESVRETDTIRSKNGRRLSVHERTVALTMGYPAAKFASTALTFTARVAWWCAHFANEVIDGIEEAPFTDEELAALTKGRVTGRKSYASIRPSKQGNVLAAKVGRNDPCPCGSGRKYKRCCWSTEPIGETPSALG